MQRHPHGRSAGPRSIPPPVHDSRSHRNYPPEWDRHHRPGAATATAVQLPVASGRSAAARPSGGGGGAAGRSSRSNGSRQPSSSRSGGQHGYGDIPPNVVGPSSNNSNVIVGGGAGGLHLGGGVGNSGGGGGGAPIAGPGSSTSGAGVLSRAQMPLPALPSSAQTQQQQSQQQQLPQQAYYAPKGVIYISKKLRHIEENEGQKH